MLETISSLFQAAMPYSTVLDTIKFLNRYSELRYIFYRTTICKHSVFGVV